MIIFDSVSKKIAGIENLSFEVQEGEILVLLGTSGCGKSTTLKMINRLIDPDEGSILVDGKDIFKQNLIELRRNIGYAVQEISLFPHMTVAENIGIAPELQGWSREKVEERVDHLLTIFGMDPQDLRHRYPRELSGGQKQRVGVARALASDPPILLMDEPFGALDPITRQQAQSEFLDLESKIKKTVIFVTHDLFEAVTIGDRIGLMDQGKLLQITTPREFVENPPSAFGDEFLGLHRFQLSLLTKPIKHFIEKPESTVANQNSSELNLKSTFFEALNLFRQSESKTLSVSSGPLYHGVLKRKTLLDEILLLLMESPSKGSVK